MTHRLATNYAENYCNRTSIVKVIVENVVTCFFGMQCSQNLTLYPLRPTTTSQVFLSLKDQMSYSALNYVYVLYRSAVEE